MTSPWELTAAALAVAYLLLAIRQNVWCWPAAIVSTAIYIFVMAAAGLYMESALQLFYVAVAVYGWWAWLHGGPGGEELAVSTWAPEKHAVAIGGILLLAWVSGALLERYTQAAYPYLDSFTTWGAVVSTWMVARKLLETWYYWFVIDSLSIYLYVGRGLYVTALLFLIYLVLVVVAFVAWRRSMLAHSEPVHAHG